MTSIPLPSLHCPRPLRPDERHPAMRFMYPQHLNPAVIRVRRSETGLRDMYWSGGYYPTGMCRVRCSEFRRLIYACSYGSLTDCLAPEMRTVYSQPAMQPQMIYSPQLPPQRHYLTRMNRPYYPPVLCCDTCCGGTCCDACCDDLCCDSCCGCGSVLTSYRRTA